MENRTMQLPQEYVDAVNDGYFEYRDNGSYIKREFIIDFPENLADMMADICPGLTASQLYEYDMDLRCWLEELESGLIDAEVVKEELWMWVAYSKAQVNKDYFPKALYEMIKLNIMRIETEDDVIAFLKHFKSFIWFLPI